MRSSPAPAPGPTPQGFRYTCRGEGNRDAFLGREEITADGEVVYWLQYAGGFIG
ncbi:DUF5680 domain-containing protein [Oerskovia sp. KBS0722]|uniref:DUF5680 domain-containing protein n=1 Tax=Oerskovia sp. KBS0722 TaxID=1179673 RepID=UPI00352AC9AC